VGPYFFRCSSTRHTADHFSPAAGNDFYPVFFEQLRVIMASRPDNPNLVQGRERGGQTKDQCPDSL